MIHDRRIKLERAAIREVADLIARSPNNVRAVHEAYFSGLLTMDQIEWTLRRTLKMKIDPVASKISKELKKEILKDAARLIRFRQDTREILTDETNTDYEKRDLKRSLRIMRRRTGQLKQRPKNT